MEPSDPPYPDPPRVRTRKQNVSPGSQSQLIVQQGGWPDMCVTFDLQGAADLPNGASLPTTFNSMAQQLGLGEVDFFHPPAAVKKIRGGSAVSE